MANGNVVFALKPMTDTVWNGVAKKNGSPKYVIDGVTYDRLKKGAPDCLHQVLRLGQISGDKGSFDVHFGEQRDPIFLLDQSPRAAAQFFASSSDAIRLMEMQTLHNQKVRQAKQEQSRLTIELEEQEAALQTLQPLEDTLAQLEEQERVFESLTQEQRSLDQQQAFVTAFQDCRLAEQMYSSLATPLQQLKPPPALEDTQPIQNTLRQLQACLATIEKTSTVGEVLNDLTPPPTCDDTARLQHYVQAIQAHQSQVHALTQTQAALQNLTAPQPPANWQDLESRLKELRTQHATVKRLTKSLAKVTQALEQTQSEMAQWIQNHEVCPTCGGQVDANLWKQLGQEERHEC